MATTKNITASSGELPQVDMPQYTHAMPARPPRTGAIRNLTGLYLGVEGSTSPPRHRSTNAGGIPPLARGRGMPSQRIRTPTEERRYKKVELLRTREDQRGFSGQSLRRRPRGLQATPVTGYPGCEADPPPGQPPTAWDTADRFWDITKNDEAEKGHLSPTQTSRNYTMANNSGVKHLEYLNSDPSRNSPDYSDEFDVSLVNTLAKEVHQLASTKKDLIGVVECYKKICKGNIDVLYSLLPSHRQNCSSANRYTGFAVKSYRNPNSAQIMSSFPPLDGRPRTVVGGAPRPYVPSPYFFKCYQPPRTAGERARPQYPTHFLDDKIVAAPGAGHLSHSVTHGRQPHATRVNTPLTADLLRNHHQNSPVGPRVTPRASALGDTRPHTTGGEKVDILLPEADSHSVQDSARDTQSVLERDGQSVSDSRLDSPDRVVTVTAPTTDPQPEDNCNNNSTTHRSSDSQPCDVTEEAEVGKMHEAGDQPESLYGHGAVGKLERMSSGTEIVIGLEDEAGEQAPVEIDEADENLHQSPVQEPVEEDSEQDEEPAPGRRVSITERVLKSRNSELQLAALAETAEDRKRELADLLNEHAQIVDRVVSMECDKPLNTPIADKENAQFGPL